MDEREGGSAPEGPPAGPDGPGGGRREVAPPPAPPDDEIAEAVAHVLEYQAEKARSLAEVQPPAERGFPLFRWLLFFVLLSVSLYLWFGSPAWLQPAPPPALPLAYEEAGLRMEIYHAALLVEDFREEEGRLPSTLGEAGDPFSELRYERLDARTYRLAGSTERLSLEYVSTEPLEAFLGDAPEVIRRGLR